MGLKPDFGRRLARLQKEMREWNCSALALSALEGFDANAYYYSGDDTFPTTLLVTPSYSAIYSLHAGDFANEFDECFTLGRDKTRLSDKLKELRVKKLGVDDLSASAGALLRIQKKLGLKLVPVGTEVAKRRLVKDEREKRCIREAGRVSLAAVEGFGPRSLTGKSEHAVAGEMELRARLRGASLDAFASMVLSGARSAFFHNHTSAKKISRGEPVLIDWGARHEHYCSDHTRTFYGGSSEKIKDAVEAVKEAKKAAEKKARIGALGSALSEASLEVIKEYGFQDYSHRKAGLSLGHFVGLDVHDTAERLEKTRLRRGMAFTIEPGIYVPGEFGVRFEDTYVL